MDAYFLTTVRGEALRNLRRAKVPVHEVPRHLLFGSRSNASEWLAHKAREYWPHVSQEDKQGITYVRAGDGADAKPVLFGTVQLVRQALDY